MSYTFSDIILYCVVSHIGFYLLSIVYKKLAKIVSEYYYKVCRAYERANRIIDRVESALSVVEQLGDNVKSKQFDLNNLAKSFNDFKHSNI